MDLLALQTHLVFRDACQDESRRQRSAHNREGAPSTHRCQRTPRAVWWRREGRVVIPSVFAIVCL